MRPLHECPPHALGGVRGVLTDIDDTLTSEGRLPARAYAAMEKIQGAGLLLIPVTGRPAGWCDHIARMWPVDAVVGENGAFWFRYDRVEHRMHRHFVQDGELRRAGRERLAVIGAEVLRRVPRAQIAADQLYREADLAIDFSEDVRPALSAGEVDAIVGVMRGHGLTVKVSSIHVNGWFGAYDKLTTARELLVHDFGGGIAAEDFCYVGDSPNDEPMFAFFPLSVGVANVLDFAERMRHRPRYITQQRGGDGFAEFADLLVSSLERPG